MNEQNEVARFVQKIAFLGTGSMAGAILRGLLESPVSVGEIVATVRSAEGAAKLQDMSGRVSILQSGSNPEANREASRDATIIFLGVKPAQVPELLEEISPVLSPDTIVVSLAAGVTTASCEAALLPKFQPAIFPPLPPQVHAIVRAMPNTPALIGQAMTGLAAGSAVSAEQLLLIQDLFETVGRVLVLPESKIDALSAISGSGPAYVYYAIEEFTRAGIELGFNEEEASLLVGQTFLGAVNLLDHTGKTAAELRTQVTSPKGTTEQALRVLAEAGLEQTFVEAARAAIARAEELASGKA
ncbi:MAG: pyrroline-5-carboxylate reductase [Microbacteriaceae bacterium]